MFRAVFEYIADAITSSEFGSDGMPVINYYGVLMHEVCLAMMVTSIKHPLVFVSLILCDVTENSFCLWSLRGVRGTAKVTPEENETEEKENKEAEGDKTWAVRQKSYIQRSTSVFTLLQDRENLSDKGTSLFIACTLLTREAVELMVPLQAAGVLTFLYMIVDKKTNSIVNTWDDSEYIRSMTYIGIDVACEIVVFVLTSIVLGHLHPEFSTTRILLGILRVHSLEIFMVTLGAWLTVLLFQTTYSGLDMTFKFDWLYQCDENGPGNWTGGYSWECNNTNSSAE